MLNQRLAWVGFFILYFTLTASAQDPGAAREIYNRGQQRFMKGDFEGAIADFTRAIEMSSGPATKDWKVKTDFNVEASASGEISFIDPFAARIYADRALAIDVMRAVRLERDGYEVWTQAIPADITPKNRLLLGRPSKPTS